MSQKPDPDIAAIFERLSMTFDRAPTGATAVMENRLQSLGPLFSVPKDVFSAHQRIALQPDLDALARIMDEIPLVAETRTGWKIALSSRGLSRRPEQGPLTFVIRLGGFDITKPASNRWRRAAEMLSRTRTRMGTVAQASKAETGAIQPWLVLAKGREDKVVILPGLKSGASFSFTGDCGRHGPAVLCRLQRRSRVAAADAVPRRP